MVETQTGTGGHALTQSGSQMHAGTSNWCVYSRLLGAASTGTISCWILLHYAHCSVNGVITSWPACLFVFLVSLFSLIAFLAAIVGDLPAVWLTGAAWLTGVCVLAIVVGLTVLELSATHQTLAMTVLVIDAVVLTLRVATERPSFKN